jgi:4-amino-4-deoxy-L-arabinose transferase-like glycosyltransferase
LPEPGGECGSASILRLWNGRISGQISWFLPPALIVSGYCLYLYFRKRITKGERHITTFYFSMCLIPMFIYFSLMNGMVHRYYLAMLSFVLAPLADIGLSLSKEMTPTKKPLLPLAFTAVAAVQLFIQSLYGDWLPRLLPVAVIILAAVSLTLLLARKKPFSGIVAYPLLATLLLPGLWSLTPAFYGGDANLPISGPELRRPRPPAR